LLDRIDIHLEMGGLSYGEMCGKPRSESSAVVRARVLAAREIQQQRFSRPEEGRCNAQMTASLLARYCVLGKEARALMKDALISLGLSARAHDRILRVARTIADLEGSAGILAEHVAEAIHYRLLDRQRQILPWSP
jgi:magnesium chelatase family protein